MGVREAVHFSRPPPQVEFEIQVRGEQRSKELSGSDRHHGGRCKPSFLLSLMSSWDYWSRSNEFIRSVLHSR
jgi:hypothetical protein